MFAILPGVTNALRASRSSFVCSACEAVSPKWQGRCAGCGSWNSLEERVEVSGHPARARAATPPFRLQLVDAGGAPPRLSAGCPEVDRVLGGGFVRGSVVLLGGDPGVGKSTLALQVAAATALNGDAALYCAGEESASQIAMRARRIGCDPAFLDVLVETDLDSVLAGIAAASAPLVVVDSVQTLFDPSVAGTAGSPAQVRNAVTRIVGVAKQWAAPVLLVGHVTKDGAIAGPRTLEHMVDVVLYLEGERLGDQRLLRGVKNRFGSTGELGLLSMQTGGMRPADAPGRGLLGGASLSIPGNALTVICEGVRPLALEVQALAVKTPFAMPRRTASGFDASRLHLLLAVLQKRADVDLSKCDVYLNVVGGVQLSDPGADLAVAMAIAASNQDRPLPPACVILGELGLGGEIRRVHRLEARLREAAALGVNRVVVPVGDAGRVPQGLRCTPVETLTEALQIA